jgi:hypothetical protein
VVESSNLDLLKAAAVIVRHAAERREHHALPFAVDLGDRGLEARGTRIEVAEFIARVAELEAESLERRIADRHLVTRADRSFQLRGLRFRAQSVTCIVESAVFPGQGAPRLAVGRIAHARRVAVAAVGLGADARGNRPCVVVGFPREHLDVGEILAVVERELRAQQLPGIVRGILLKAQVATQQRFLQRALLDGRLPNR